MQVHQTKYDTFTLNFPSPSQYSNARQQEQETDTLSKFIQKCPYLDFPAISNMQQSNSSHINNHLSGNSSNQLIEKFKKQIIAFSIQYGTRNQKTTSVFLKFLEATRDLGTQELKKKQYASACYYYTMCLGFVQPQDEQYLQKFIIIKVNIINKMMFAIFELVREKKQPKYFDQAISFMEHFFASIKEYVFYLNLLKSGVIMIQLNYFYLARMYKKRKNITKAIEKFQKAQQIINDKFSSNAYDKNPSLQAFAQNLYIKTLYKISKCYRQDSSSEEYQQGLYEQLALKKAESFNPHLYQYISQKIRMYKSGKQFTELLSKLQNKKKIQEMVLNQIEQSTQKQITSLYDIYLDRPNLNFSTYFHN